LALSDITDWPGIEAVARSSNKGETVDSGTLNIPDWPRIEAVAEFRVALYHIAEWPRIEAVAEFRLWPRIEAVAEFRLRTGHDCLAKHLHR
uniref:Transcriptional regulator n=1 Tax=Rodentolepis nana TaxID=102285 RepID=A0A0R3THZ6_RODNA